MILCKMRIVSKDGEVLILEKIENDKIIVATLISDDLLYYVNEKLGEDGIR